MKTSKTLKTMKELTFYFLFLSLSFFAKAQNYGDIVKIKHVLTNAHLHSHAINYGHPQSSGQQQVTAFGGADDNDYWVIKPEHGNNNRSGSVRHGDVIRLEHYLTRRNLHSHAGIPSPVTGQQEVTCFGENGNGDSNDNWRIEIDGGGTWAANRRIRLIHINTNHALHSHAGHAHPQWTAGQQEVTGFGGRDDNDWWVLTEIKPRVMTRFDPVKHGYKFANNFTVQTQLAGFNGPTFGGLCGGMVYSALDYFHAGMTIPQQNYMPAEGMPLQSYIWQRQQQSAFPNADKWIEYGINPFGEFNRKFFNWGLELGSGRLGELMSKIDRGEPVPLGLKDCGNDCRCPGGNCPGSHQVLAIGYEMGRYKGDLGANIEDLSIFVYDPNYPGRTMTLRPDVNGAMYLYREEGQAGVHACRWRAYFTDMKYTRANPPAISNLPNELVATFVTGGDDLRGGNDNVHLVLILRSGATLRFDNVNNGRRWVDNSTQSISRPLDQNVRRGDIAGVRVEFTGSGGMGGDNWNLDKLTIRLSGETHPLFHQEGAPLVRFTGDNRSREFRF
ncbi:MAG: hypothetical protein IAE84_12825 [Saprospiraceae bacterium]|nr:hypothetical protein [Saprospiraceae bacterium]